MTDVDQWRTASVLADVLTILYVLVWFLYLSWKLFA